MIIKLVHLDSPYTLTASQFSGNYPTSELRIECDTTAGVIVVNLPAVSALDSIAPKVIVSDISGTAQTNNITVNADLTVPDTFNGANAAQVISQAHGSARFEVTRLNTSSNLGDWLVTAGNAQSGPLKVVSTTTGTYAADGSEDIILVNTSTSAVTVTLASASRAVKKTIIKDKSSNATAKNITVLARLGDTLDAATVIVTSNGSVGVFNGGPGTTVNYTYAPNL